MQEQASGFAVQLLNASANYALLALQGPRSLELLQPLAPEVELAGLRRFHHRMTEVVGVPTLLSATGYTGEDGYELYLPATACETVAEALAARAADLMLQDFFCGLGARDSLRLESGYPLYGHEISEQIDPITAGLGWTVKFNKSSDFVGRAALQQIKEQGRKQALAFFKLADRRIARQGEVVWMGDEAVGTVCSGTYSPLAEVAIGSMLVRSDLLGAGGLEVRLRGQASALTQVKPPIR